MERRIRNSGKALIIRDGKMLAVRLRDTDGEYYIMPGGGQEPGELLPYTLRREVLEETGIHTEPKELVFVVEGLAGEPFHRVDLVFLCEYLGEAEKPMLCGDTNQTGMEWLDISVLHTTPLYPSRLRRQIMNLYEGKPYRIYLGNENMGDPEITE